MKENVLRLLLCVRRTCEGIRGREHTPPRVFFVRAANKGVMVDARQFRVNPGQET